MLIGQIIPYHVTEVKMLQCLGLLHYDTKDVSSPTRKNPLAPWVPVMVPVFRGKTFNN